MNDLIPEPEICPKRIHGVNWYDKLEQPRKENMEGCKELIKMMDTYWKYQIKEEEEKREELIDTVEEQNEKSLERNEDFLKKISPQVPVYYEPDIDYENLDVELKYVTNKDEKNIWKYFRHIVSTVPNRGVIGKNLRFFLWDNTSDTVLAIGGLASPMPTLKPREEYYGLDCKKNEEFLEKHNISLREYNPNAHTIVPLQPFGMFTGGKLLTMLISTDEMIDKWKNEYSRKPWGFHTTSIYGKSIQYDRLYDWDYVGMTKGSQSALHYSGINVTDVIKYLNQFFDMDMDKFDLSKGASAIGVSRITAVQNALFGDISLETEKSFVYHGVGRGIYCCNVWNNFTPKDWYEGNLEIDRTVHKYPNDESIKHKQIDTVKNKFEFWYERWFKRRYEKHKDKIREWSPEDYQYGDSENQSDLDKWF